MITLTIYAKELKDFDFDINEFCVLFQIHPAVEGFIMHFQPEVSSSSPLFFYEIPKIAKETEIYIMDTTCQVATESKCYGKYKILQVTGLVYAGHV